MVPRKGKGTQLLNEIDSEEEERDGEERGVSYFLMTEVCLTDDGKVREREEKMDTVRFRRCAETNGFLAALPNGHIWLCTCQVINIKYKNKICSSN